MKLTLLCVVACLIVICSANPMRQQSANSQSNMEFLRRFMSGKGGAMSSTGGAVQTVPRPAQLPMRQQMSPFWRTALMAGAMDGVDDFPFFGIFD